MNFYLKHEVQGLIKITNGFKIGRKNADLVFRNDEHMSSSHCEFLIKKGKLFLVDLESKNGVLINTERISAGVEYLLMPGTMLEIGSQKFQVIQNNIQK